MWVSSLFRTLSWFFMKKYQIFWVRWVFTKNIEFLKFTGFQVRMWDSSLFLAHLLVSMKNIEFSKFGEFSWKNMEFSKFTGFPVQMWDSMNYHVFYGTIFPPLNRWSMKPIFMIRDFLWYSTNDRLDING
jgi:hypothetical protein